MLFCFLLSLVNWAFISFENCSNILLNAHWTRFPDLTVHRLPETTWNGKNKYQQNNNNADRHRCDKYLAHCFNRNTPNFIQFTIECTRFRSFYAKVCVDAMRALTHAHAHSFALFDRIPTAFLNFIARFNLDRFFLHTKYVAVHRLIHIKCCSRDCVRKYISDWIWKEQKSTRNRTLVDCKKKNHKNGQTYEPRLVFVRNWIRQNQMLESDFTCSSSQRECERLILIIQACPLQIEKKLK